MLIYNYQTRRKVRKDLQNSIKELEKEKGEFFT